MTLFGNLQMLWEIVLYWRPLIWFRILNLAWLNVVIALLAILSPMLAEDARYATLAYCWQHWKLWLTTIEPQPKRITVTFWGLSRAISRRRFRNTINSQDAHSQQDSSKWWRFTMACQLYKSWDPWFSRDTCIRYVLSLPQSHVIEILLADGLLPVLDVCHNLVKLNLTGCRGVRIADRRRFFEVCTPQITSPFIQLTSCGCHRSGKRIGEQKGSLERSQLATRSVNLWTQQEVASICSIGHL